MKENLTEQIETAANKLAQLEAEQADFQNRMTLAVNDADSASIISLRHRITDLPVEIFAAQLRLKRLTMQRDEEKLPELEAEAQRLSPPIFELQKQVAELQTELNMAVGSQQDAAQRLKDLRDRIRNRRLEIEQLIYSAKPTTGQRQSTPMNFGG